METNHYRSMRLLLFYDLPSKTKNDLKIYNKFRKELLNYGFIMIQYSVYCRFCRNHAAVQKQVRRIDKIKPQKGDIRIMIVTEKQYLDMIFISGDFNYLEEKLSVDPIVEV